MADPDTIPEDERIPEPTIDDDETSTDPVDETGDELDEGDELTAEDDSEPEGDEPPVAASRGDRQVGALRAERRRLAEENARITRELNELRSRPPQPVQPQETPQQRQERLALLSPEERTQAIIEESLTRHNQQQNQVMGQLLDQADRTSFEAKAINNPLLRKLAPQVEAMHASLRAQGRPVDRDTVAKFLIGQKVLEQSGKAKPAARQRQRQQQARPANGAGDVQPQRRERARGGGDTASDLEARFGDVPI